MFFVAGDAGDGLKRDPYARELATPFPGECVLRSSDFPWHDSRFQTPRFEDFVIYQLHVGTFFTANLPRKGGTFLDVAGKIPDLAALGVVYEDWVNPSVAGNHGRVFAEAVPLHGFDYSAAVALPPNGLLVFAR